MAIAVTITDRWNDGKRLHVSGTLGFSGNYATGGDTLDFTGKVTASRAPVDLSVDGQAGFKYNAVKGTTIANNKVKVFQTGAAVSSPFAELAAAAYPAGVTGDTVGFQAIFKLL